MIAIIPAAGYGTRLYPLTRNIPKALLEINSKPILEHILERILKIKEVDSIVIVTNNRFYNNFLEWKKNYNGTIPIKIINDGTESNKTRLGAIKDINLAIKQEGIEDDILVINSDNIFTFNLEEIYESFKKNSDTIAIYDVKSREIVKKHGHPVLDENNKLISFTEKPKNPTSSLAVIGIWLLSKETTKLIKRFSDEGDCDPPGKFIEWLYKRRDIYCHIFNKPDHVWFDIGSHNDFKMADLFFKQLKSNPVN